jgi:hypothetical protein
LSNGPQLFIDDYLIGASENIVRVVNQPERSRRQPLISGLDKLWAFRNINFTASVVRDPVSGRFRMWYVAYEMKNQRRFTAYVESADGVEWERPFVRIAGTSDNPITAVFDEGLDFANPLERFKSVTTSDLAPGWVPSVLYSTDGLAWEPAEDNPLTSTWYGEIWRAFALPGGDGYGFLHRWNKDYTWQDAGGTWHRNTSHDDYTRLIAYASSADFESIEPSRVVFAPDELDAGETQFYAVSNIIRRGDLYLTMLSVLRDDLKAAGTPETVYSPDLDTTFPVYGMGYTVLAWSRDGQTWFRDREADAYFEPDPNPSAWDHAHAWISSMVEVDDAVYMYYGGYKYGHKALIDRQIGLVTRPRDRYVARQAGETPGTLRTPLISMEATDLYLNVNAEAGEVRFQVLDANGEPIPGYRYADCPSLLQVSAISAAMECARPLADLAGYPIQFEFGLTNARLFAFELDTATP